MQLTPEISVLIRSADDPATLRARVSAVRAVAGFDVQATHAGDTQHFSVHYETTLGDAGKKLADGVLAHCERDYTAVSNHFGGLQVSHFNVILASGIGGAYHYGCGATDLYCDAGGNADRANMLVVAEEVEVFEDVQARGWNCGASNGEGLSRVLAADLHPQAAREFSTAAAWLDTPDRPDWVDRTDPTDTNFVSTGCAVLFLNYLRYQLQVAWPDVVQAAGTTLATTYAALTGRNDGFHAFRTLLDQYFPVGRASGLTTDNPFPLQ
jgi:hypothetical protein